MFGAGPAGAFRRAASPAGAPPSTGKTPTVVPASARSIPAKSGSRRTGRVRQAKEAAGHRLLGARAGGDQCYQDRTILELERAHQRLKRRRSGPRRQQRHAKRVARRRGPHRRERCFRSSHRLGAHAGGGQVRDQDPFAFCRLIDHQGPEPAQRHRRRGVAGGLGSAARGRVNQKSEPSPHRLSTPIAPPIKATSWRADRETQAGSLRAPAW